ncbi:MAG: phospho-N-acetylmuramoyl-pentapeptide-transferase [Clostridia bacterium]|nr:phospho-N-acetylmuramoyl-pentapeptide-transferase [Clostridia bacterium]
MNWLYPIATAAVSLILTFLLGYVVIPFMHKLKFGQTILDIGPRWHKNKQGTPTMGGFMFIIAGVLSIAAFLTSGLLLKYDVVYKATQEEYRLVSFLASVGMALLMSLIGFMDDYIKVVKKRNLGLTAKQKTLLQLLVGAAYLYSLYLGGMRTTWIPFAGAVPIDSGWGLFFWPIALIFIYGFTNAVNLTDGVDGLASAVTAVVALFFLFFALRYPKYQLTAITAAALLGGCLGFLIWNHHPAKVFMGDTGSMFLGGMVVGLSFMLDRPILLMLAGILYLGEALSVTIQVAYYKRTKKRLFKMSPIHHHFELSGWSENKIVIVFSTVSLIGCLLAAALYYFA